MTNITAMINEVKLELKFVYDCDTNAGKSIADINATIKSEENEMSDERRTYLYNLLVRFLSARADNAVKIEALKATLRSLENLDSVYSTIK